MFHHRAAIPIIFAAMCLQAYAALYTVEDLGTLGGSESYALAVNDAGQVVGWSTLSSGQRQAFLWEEGTLTPLGTLGGAASVAWDINEAGVVVGESDTAGGQTHAFYWNGAMHDIHSLALATYSVAWSINENGEIMGAASYASNNVTHAFYYSLFGFPAIMYDFHSVDAATYSEAFAINDASEFAGAFIPKGETESQGFIGSLDQLGPRMTSLGTFGGPRSMARAINNLGHIAGWALTEDEQRHAFLWDGEQLLDLNRLDSNSEASAVNEDDVVVGVSFTDNRVEGRAFVWRPSGQMEDLNSLVVGASGWTLWFARDVNNAGWIVGQGLHNGQRRAFLLRPVEGEIPGDVDGDGVATALDVQLVVNGVLGVDIGEADADVDGNGVIDAVDVQRVVNAVLGVN